MSKWISDAYIKRVLKNNRLAQGNCEYKLWEQEVDKKVDAMPGIEVMDVVTAYQQGWCDALDASIKALNDAKFQLAKADRKTEPTCDDCIWNVCNYNKVPWGEGDEPQTCNDCDQQRCETCVTEIGKTEPLTCFNSDKYESCEYANTCDDHICTKAFVELVRKAKAEMPLEVSKE